MKEGRDGLAAAQAAFAGAMHAFDGPWSAGLLSRVVPGGELDAASALNVYRSSFVARLTEQLGETFATVWRVLGDDGFLEACENYIAVHPSSSYNLSDYGRGFPAWIASHPLAARMPFLEELGEFELAFHDLFHAPAPEGGDAAGAARLAASGNLSGVTLALTPARKLVALRHAVHDLFARRRDEGPLDVDVERPQWMMLYRRGAEVMALEVGEGTFAALEALAGGATVEEALDAAVARDSAFGQADAARLFEILVASGVVTRWGD